MDKLKLSKVGGFPLVLDDLQFLLGRLGTPDEGIYPAFNNLLRGFGSDFIVQGCVLGGVSGAFTLTEGWIMLDGELIKVDAQTAFDEATNNKFVKATTFDPRGEKTFLNGAINQTYEKNRASITGTSGNLDFDANTFFSLSNQAAFGSGIVTLQKKVIEIGVWNMDTATSINVAHGLSDKTKLRRADVIIQDNGGGNVWKLDTGSPPAGSIEGFGNTNVNLFRASGGLFDDAFFNDGNNRGWLTLEFEA